MRARPSRGVLIGLGMVAAVFAAAGADLAATEDSDAPAQLTVGGDNRFAEETDDYVVDKLDLPNGEQASVGDALDLSDVEPAGERPSGR